MGVESLGPAMLTWATWCDRGGEMAATVSKARAAGYDPGDVEDFSRAKPDGSVLRWSPYRHYTRADGTRRRHRAF